MTEIKQKHFSFVKDSSDEWIKAAHRIYTKQKQAEAVEKAEGREFYPIGQEGLHPHEKIECLRKWGVPERILANLGNISGLVNTKAKKAVSNFVMQPRDAWCLVLSGGKGTGKSTAAAVWLYENTPTEAPSYKSRYWWTGTRIARTNGYNKDYEKMLESQYMVIDDLGIEYLDKNGNFLQRLDELMDERYSNFRRTVITTNLNAEAFKERYGDRVSDRLRESFSAGGQYVEIPEESMRKVRGK
jgi:DNA replication protein DnaC|tara:strand:+ start:849 stop:1577 length:729 start_codon:yes stop_codon:yes gene_type:complete